MHSNGGKEHLRDKNFDSGSMHRWIFGNHVVSSCNTVLFLRFQGWSYTSRATGKIPDVQGYLVVHVINSDREYFFFSWKVWLKLIYSCRLTSCIQFGLADKSLQMHPLFSQWPVKKALNTEYLIMWERHLGYWLSFQNEFLCGLSAFVSVAHTGRPSDAGKTWDGPRLWSVKAGKN